MRKSMDTDCLGPETFLICAMVLRSIHGTCVGSRSRVPVGMLC